MIFEHLTELAQHHDALGLYGNLLLLLLFGHALADYPFQGDFLANAKRGNVAGMPWWIAMAAHCFIHAGTVLIVTGSAAVAVGEFIMHFVIDLEKCKGNINMKTDQMLHVLCKILWAFIIAVTI